MWKSIRIAINSFEKGWRNDITGFQELHQNKYGQLIFTKTQMQFNGERVVFSTDGVETIGHPYAKNKLANTALNIKPHAEIN